MKRIRTFAFWSTLTLFASFLPGCIGGARGVYYGGVNSVRDPEIVVDMPWRLEPGEDLPVYVVLKDAEHTSASLSGFRVEVLRRDGKTEPATWHWEWVGGNDIYA
ncbi:MAG: hypothetical protein RDV41_13215, partial [Planctomycetota bacterium]|nr:hypothetical protein [Planctomycetota bacterium]